MSTGLKHLDLTFDEFKALVKTYYEKCDGASPSLQYTLPGLAIHLGWKVDDILTFPKDSPFYPIIEHSMLLCEESLIQAMAKGNFDRSTGELILINHFNYQKKLPEAPDSSKKTISQVLQELKANKLKQSNG
jgi:hypothetical protein